MLQCPPLLSLALATTNLKPPLFFRADRPIPHVLDRASLAWLSPYPCPRPCRVQLQVVEDLQQGLLWGSQGKVARPHRGRA